MRLNDYIDFAEDASQFEFLVSERIAGRETRVDFLDEYGLGSRNASFFVAGFEFGPHVLIHADSFESAWEAWVDSSKTIPESELIEAYGITDDDALRARYTEGHGECPPYWQREAWDAWHDGLRLAQTWYLAELGDKAHAGECDYPDLVEGYEYQSNATGTGIVSMGHYAWMNEIDPEDITIRRKGEEG